MTGLLPDGRLKVEKKVRLQKASLPNFIKVTFGIRDAKPSSDAILGYGYRL